MFASNIYTLFYLSSLLYVFFVYLIIRNSNKINDQIKSFKKIIVLSSFWISLQTISSLLNPALSFQIIIWKLIISIVILNSLAVFNFTNIFLEKNERQKKHKILKILYYVIALLNIFSDKFIVSSNNLEFPPFIPGNFFIVFVILVVTPLSISLFEILKKLNKLTGNKKKQSISISLGISSLILIGGTTSLLLPLLNIPFPRLDFLAAIIFLFLILFSVEKHGFIGLKIGIQQKIMFVSFILTLIPLLIAALTIFKLNNKTLIDVFIQKNSYIVETNKTNTEKTMLEYKNMILFLSNLPKIKEAANNYDDLETKKLVAEIFEIKTNLETSINQIRLIDIDGWEKIRVDRIGGEIIKIPEKNLQYKGNRDYTIKTSELTKNEVYYSPIELNKEGNPPIIEYPFSPTIRLSTIVWNENGTKKIGYLVINFNAHEFIDFEATEYDDQNLIIVNQDGTYVFNKKEREKLWGGKNDLANGISLANDDNELWKLINQNQTNFSLTKNNKIYNTSRISYNNKENKQTLFFISETSIKSVLKPLDELNNLLFYIIVITAIFSIIIGYKFSKTISNPIIKLRDAIDNFSLDNDQKIEVNFKSNDETNDLKESFILLGNKLRNSYDETDRKITEQTAKITANNEKLEKQRRAMLNLLEDINEEKDISIKNAQELEKFKLAVDNTSEQIIITDQDGVVLYANKATETTTGFKIKEVLNRKAGLLWGKLMTNAWYQDMWKQIKTDKKLFRGILENKRKNGEHYFVDFQVYPLLNEEKNVSFFVSTSRDITKEKEIDRMKTDFISLASHQLRTPLSSIKWFIEMMLDGDFGKLKKEQKDVIEDINSSNERMISLVNSLLNVSRIESGRIIVDPEPTNLGELIKKIIEELKAKLDERKQKIIFSSNSKLEKINIDTKLIREVITNLLTNAMKYSPEKSEILVFLSKKNKEIVVQVSDDGYGIPKDEQTKIFQRFFRASNITKKETDGTGLGLYLVKSIIESSGGKIWLESEEGKGTTFWFTLPIKGMQKKEGVVSLNN